MLQRGCHFTIGYPPLNHQLSHTRIDTAFSPGIYPRHGCSLWIYPPAHWVYTRISPTHWVYTRITPFALVIYEDSTHINPDMGHGINTGMHICPDSGLSTTSMVECLFFCLRDNFFMLAIYLSLVQSAIKSLTH